MSLFGFLARPSLMMLVGLILVMWIPMMMMTTTPGRGGRGRSPSHFGCLRVEIHIPPLF
jgi:hypothetical protein